MSGFSLPVGTKIRCSNPNCKADIATVVKELRAYERPTRSHFEFVDHQPKPYERMECHKCKTMYFVGGCMSTSEGWKPRTPIEERTQ